MGHHNIVCFAGFLSISAYLWTVVHSSGKRIGRAGTMKCRNIGIRSIVKAEIRVPRFQALKKPAPEVLGLGTASSPKAVWVKKKRRPG